MNAAIRTLNDQARRYMGAKCRAVMTSGIAALGPEAQLDIVRRVRSFDDFTPANDPHGEHDFGVFDYEDHRINWKIDYYDNELEFGSEDPADPACTQRVLTIMLAEER